MKTRLIITMLALFGIFQFAGAQTIRDNSNVAIGKIERDGTVRNAGNVKIGSIENDGTVKNASNVKIGKVESNGSVRNASNMTIGKAENVSTRHAALFFFFGFFR